MSRSVPKLSDLARKVVIPKGVTSTGWPAVERKCSELGIRFRPWQPDVGRLILAKRADGKYASTIGGTGMSIPRQVGKTFLVGAIVFALCLLLPKLTVIWTAHRLRTAEETFGKMKVFTKRRTIEPYILKVLLGSGEEEIQFRNGSRILFGARERGFGRGFDEVDVLIFDEAQILTEHALDDMIPATNQSRQATGALLLFMGTPPKPTDPSDVFRRMRTEALSGEDDDTGWVEFGADADFIPTPSPAPLMAADWEQVEKANPSYPEDTPPEAILRMRKKLGPESFLREGLGIWDGEAPNALPGWGRLATDQIPPAPDALGVASDPSGAWYSLGAFGSGFVAPVDRRRAEHGRKAFVKHVADVAHRHNVPVAVGAKGMAGVLIEDLENEGVYVIPTTLDDLVQASADFADAIDTGAVSHGAMPDLDDAVLVSSWRKVGDRRALDVRGADVSMLEAVVLARHVAALVGPMIFT